MKKGITLIELLVIFAIIGIFSSIILVSLNSVREKNERSEYANYIVDFDGKKYWVESYTKENGGQCVFLSEKEIRFCGNWSVEKIYKDE